MIAYEVNIQVPISIYNDYLIWLKDHIGKMLTFKGFIKHTLYIAKSKDANDVNLCVHYYIKSIKYYDLYIQNNSKKMRNNNVDKFIDKINISRRVLIETDI
jgi:hypothetical protein